MGDKSFQRTLIVTLFLFLGLLIGVLLVPALNENAPGYRVAIAGLILITVSIIGIRWYVAKQRKALKTEGDVRETSEVGFVVDTFHEVVEKLKEKERELEKLKAVAEEKATSIEAYNANILQNVPSGVVSIDNAMLIKSVNQAAERILGVNSSEITGRNFNEVFREPLTSLVFGEMTVSRGEYAYLTDDNRHIWLGITTSRLKNASEENIGLIFVFTDLTDIKALQARVELKERLSHLGEMSAGISHELRNSMAVISGYAKLLSRKVDPSVLPTVHSISSEIASMDTIISELLAFAKPSVLSTERIALDKLLKDTAASVLGGNSLIRSSITISDTIFVEADEVLLRQALTNLLNNAAEAMPYGGEVEITLCRINSGAEISIRDTGSGIAEDIIHKIFLPFYTTKEKGIGFGLALVQKIIISHGGSIDVQSAEGEGATFRIVLPAV